MKNYLIFVLIIAALGALGRLGIFHHDSGQDHGPLAHPVYAELRFRADFHDRTLHMVAIAKGYDQADCQRMQQHLPDRFRNDQNDSGTPSWGLESSECKTTLDKRTAELFDNKPTFVNYVSASPGTPEEREIRLIFWGVTAREGELVCNEVPNVQQQWKGTVTCIRALPAND